MTTTQLAMGHSPLDVQRQMGHTTLAMTNHYASLTINHLQKSHEKYFPLKNEGGHFARRALVLAIGMNEK